MTRALVVVATLGLALACGPARGEPEEEAIARAHFVAGRAAFGRGDFRAALDDFEAAYAVAPRPELLFNIARCREELHDRAGAIDAYRLYLPLASPTDRIEVATMIKRLERAAPPPPRRRGWIAAAVIVPIGGVGLALGLGLGLGLRASGPHALPSPSWSPAP